jgi:hypothetical protein
MTTCLLVPSSGTVRAQRHHLAAASAGIALLSVALTLVRKMWRVTAVSESSGDVVVGDVIEFTLRGERRTAETMLLTDDDLVLLDLFDGDRPAWARLSVLSDVAVFRPDAKDVVSAA